ncbi:nucleophile aminohydrolase [Aspergillus pseudonomiae]|uniref:Nucleophile aminohydrolase n=1 Tax=Aspergillus pseudonomiae TaxID=1506151 RepID=A0A5N6HSE2_9EURO|nr:nucleophile aminohydrolase [Aspergillus pseudonomiae]KAB8257336.1 nucleophile aminohydrolase [Aspergillus pseudonomiae]KAE8399695.1 nucleophile aminohydrolase [Aspergillus pseudonomiae]
MSRPRRDDVSAIFVHAGAGFHSPHNEKLHLETCENAAKVAIQMLKNGGSAVDAVEIAIMLLEDSEITNAGYGSNLTIDGAVECDATIVNHLGRSGAAGAVSQVKNPISLARVVLEASTKPLTLQRVPPNFLVGQGATSFAYEQGLIVIPHDGLISEEARGRWLRWQQDLEAAESKEAQQFPARYERHKAYIRRPVSVNPTNLLSSPSSIRPASSLSSSLGDTRLRNSGISSPVSSSDTLMLPPRARDAGYMDGIASQAPRFLEPSIDVEMTPPSVATDIHHADMDQISDTVGAIAVDSQGNIAAGSSSGGIGMKHRGRIGPAALVGIGTAVIPLDPNDPDQTCVATVTSGTGEHIATSMAASTCASRIYYNQRKCEDGSFEEVTEDEALRGMIASEFMGHPGVKDSHCRGAIGIMAVKKTVDGVYLCFGHNTDSFALASMSSEDKKPVSVMSRSNGNGSIAQGGRAYRSKR